MLESQVDLETLWKQDASASVDPILLRSVRRQTWVWSLTLGLEVVGVVIGIAVPLFKVLLTPEPFWIVWALDLWGVVGVAAWFVFIRARHLLAETDRTTEAYGQLLLKRHRFQIKASRIGVALAALQFVILPLLMWWQVETTSIDIRLAAATYGSVLLVMAGYIVVMLRIARNSRLEAARLPTA